MTSRISMEKPNGDYLQYLSAYFRIILKYILEKLDGKAWNGFIFIRIATIGGSL